MMRLHPQPARRRPTSAAPEEPWADRIEEPEVARSGHDGHLGSHAEYRPGAPAEESNRLTIFEPAGMIFVPRFRNMRPLGRDRIDLDQGVSRKRHAALTRSVRVKLCRPGLNGGRFVMLQTLRLKSTG